MADSMEVNEERVTAESYGSLNTSNAADECWVIRIPKKLSELWEKAPEGTDLGEMVFTKGGTTATGRKVKPSLTVHVSESLVEQMQPPVPHNRNLPPGTVPPSSMPLNYSLQAMTKKVPVMHPFVRNPYNGSVQVLGTVTRTANMQVEQDQNYRTLLKDRLIATNINSNRFVKPMEQTESIIAKQKSTLHNSKKRGFGDAVSQTGQRLLDAAQERSLLLQQQMQGRHKKARKFAPDQPIKSVLFELFGEQQFWTVKDLKAAAAAGGCTSANTKRAETEIRDILRNEIGEYHRSGDHKNMWELKKEFQQQT